MRYTITFILVFLAYCSAAQAQGPIVMQMECMSTTELVGTLKKVRGENLTQTGVTTSGGILNVYIGDTSWSVTVRVPETGGAECILISGESWEFAIPKGKGT